MQQMFHQNQWSGTHCKMQHCGPDETLKHLPVIVSFVYSYLELMGKRSIWRSVQRLYLKVTIKQVGFI